MNSTEALKMQANYKTKWGFERNLSQKLRLNLPLSFLLFFLVQSWQKLLKVKNISRALKQKKRETMSVTPPPWQNSAGCFLPLVRHFFSAMLKDLFLLFKKRKKFVNSWAKHDLTMVAFLLVWAYIGSVYREFVLKYMTPNKSRI